MRGVSNHKKLTMKLSDKIGFFTFWINVIAILLWLSIFPSFIVFPDILEKTTANNGFNPINITLCIIFFGAAIHWCYCIWFLLKFDRYSLSILPLFFLNILYAPIYFYRVKIRKRPLRNKIKIVKDDMKIDYFINEEE